MSESEASDAGGRGANDRAEDASSGSGAEFKDDGSDDDDDDDDVDADDSSEQDVVAPGYANKKKKKQQQAKVSKKLQLPQGFDADLYGLRRSVSTTLSSRTRPVCG